MTLSEDNKKLDVPNTPLVEDLLVNWGYEIKDNVSVKDILRIKTELEAWGINTKWNF